MQIKKVILASTIILSFLSGSVATAAEKKTISSDTQQCTHHHHTSPNLLCHSHHEKLLTSQQRSELETIIKTMRAQMRPLLKEKQSLRLQIMGKIATPNMTWGTIAPLLNSFNENNAKINELFMKTQFSTFQKLGVMLPVSDKDQAYQLHKKPVRHHQYC